jgi:hypothetical protein
LSTIGDCDLEATFGALASCLPEDAGGEPGWLKLSADNLPVPKSDLVTSRLCMTWGYHLYNDHPVESISIELDKATCRHLGLLILSCIFHREPERVVVHLRHPRSKITRLILEYGWDDDERSGYVSQPLCFNYYPELPARHPWFNTALMPRDLPVLSLTNEEEMVIRPEDFPGRNVAVGFGEARASCLMADLFLNASLETNHQLELQLEGECGFRGVGLESAEIRIWLPGSLGYLDGDVSTETAGMS